MNVAISGAVIVIVVVAVSAGQGPDTGTILVTVYVPGVLADKFTRPVFELMFNPAVDVNVPALPPPINIGNGFAAS